MRRQPAAAPRPAEGPQLVSGWSEDAGVYLVWRDGTAVSVERREPRWAAFVRGLDDEDRWALQRSPDVSSLVVEGDLARVEWRTRWARRQAVGILEDAIGVRSITRSLGEGRPGEVLEADVSPLRRLLSDDRRLQVCPSPRLAYLDLEVDSRGTFPERVEGRRRVLSWAVAYPGGRVVDGVLAADRDDAERDLLLALFAELDGSDVILGWNGDAFDFPVLENRARRLKVRPGGRLLAWQRWCWLDQMLCLRKYNQAHESGEERASYALDAVARRLLGGGKVSFPASRTWEAWLAGGERREELRRYNRGDAALMPQVEERTGYVALHLAVAHLTRCFPDSSSLGAGQQGDGFLLALGAERGHRFPTRRHFDGDHSPFEGAYVMEPRRLGAVEGVHVADFAGMYPSIMRSWNMSPETVVVGFRTPATVPRCRLPDSPTEFRTDVRGIFPTALDVLVAKRAEYTRSAEEAEPGSPEWYLYKRLSGGAKVVVNSFYGVAGSPFTRYHDVAVAQGVTRTGAWLLKHVDAVAQRAGLAPFYGDTDAILVAGGPGTEERFARLVETLNASWPALLARYGAPECRLKLEYEKSFSRMVLVSAKRYAAKFSRYKGKPAPPDMRPEVKGLEFKRGDSLRLARELQKEVVDLLLSGPALPAAVELRALVDRWRARLLEGELAAGDLATSQTLTRPVSSYVDRYTTDKCTGRRAGGKCGHDFGGADAGEHVPSKCPKCGQPRKLAAKPPHVRVALVLAERGEDVTPGSKVEYLVVGAPEGEEDDQLRVVPASEPGALERVDRSYYWEKRVFPPTARVLEVVYPDVAWVPTAAQRRQAEREEARRADAGRIDDLPLFMARR